MLWLRLSPAAMASILWFLLLVPPGLSQFDSISQTIIELRNLLNVPLDISLVICHKVVKIGLLRNLTSQGLLFGGNFETTMTLGGQEKTLIVLDVNCPSSERDEILQQSQFNLIYSHWLIVDSSDIKGTVREPKLEQLLVHAAISQSTEMFYFQQLHNEVRLKQAYKLYKVNDSAVIFENYGTFLGGSSFRNMRMNNISTVRRKDLQGSVFDLAITVQDPDTLNHLNDFVNPEIDGITKNGLRLALVLLEYLNARPNWVVSKGWGQYYPAANNWTGMLGDLWAGRAEFAGSPCLVKGTRLEVADYLSNSIETWSRIVFRAPKLSYTTNVYLLPFRKIVWFCAIFLIGVIIALLLLATWNEWNVLVPAFALSPDRDMLAPKISDVMFLILGNVCSQGSPATPRSTAGRIIIIFCLIFIVCLYVSYCAFIVALLQSPSTNIRTVNDLINSHIPVGNEDTGFFRFWMQRLTDPSEKALYEKRILNKDGTENYFLLEDGVKRMQKGLFAFHMETPSGYRILVKHFKEHEKCDLREIPFADFRSPYFVCRKHSVFKEILRIMILRIKENGVQLKLWNDVYVLKPRCTQAGNFIPLSIMDISPVIFIFLGGISLSLCVFLLEIVIHKYAAQIFKTM